MSEQHEIREELRARFPGRDRTRGGAIVLFCVECCGGERAEARRCAERSCFLWPFGPAARYERAKAKGEATETPPDDDETELFPVEESTELDPKF